MKASIKNEILNPNSTERKTLTLRGISVGTYNYGDYSKYALMRIQNRNPIAKFENCICGIISKYFDIPMNTADDVINAINICKEKENCTLEGWINTTLHKLGEGYSEN